MQTSQLKLDLIQKIIENDIMTVFFHYYLPTSPDTHEVMLYLRDMGKDVRDGVLKINKHEIKAILRWIKDQFRYSFENLQIVPTLIENSYNLVVVFNKHLHETKRQQIKELFQACPNILYIFVSDAIDPESTGEAI